MSPHPEDSTKLMVLCLLCTATATRQVAALESDAIGQQPQQTNWMPMEDSWNYWWSYSGVSGPSYWGLLNPDWFLCHKGRHQSPVNIDTRLLVYDPHLKPLRADNNLISGVLLNDGHSIVFNCSRAAVQLAATSLGRDLLLNTQESHGNDSASANSNNNNNKRQSDEKLIDSVGLDGFSFAMQDKELAHLAGKTYETTIGQTNQLLEGAENVVSVEGGGQSVDSSQQQQQQQQQLSEVPKIKLSGAGLAYQYQVEVVYFKFGPSSSAGSEHQINGKSFPAELQLFSFNSNLFDSFAEAASRPNGLLAISVMIKVVANNGGDGDTSPSSPPRSQAKEQQQEQPNEQLERLLAHLSLVNYRGSSAPVRDVNLTSLLPELDEFVAYQGSLSQPSCQESVNWLILNKPLLMSQSSLDKLRSMSADEQSVAPSGTLLAGNIRPTQPINSRPIRTNIKPTRSSSGAESRDSNVGSCQRLWTKYDYKRTEI